MSSAFVPDTVDSKEDLHLLESCIESSLTWKSKHTPLQTWFKRWSRIKWIPHLFGRILKPSQQKDFETKWTSSLEDIHANRSAMQENVLEEKIQDTCGLSSSNTFTQLNLFNVSLKTSKGTSARDYSKSSLIWSEQVTKQRGEYLARKKSVRTTKEKEFLFWPTPSARDYKGAVKPETLARKKRNPLTNSLPDAARYRNGSGYLNPNWIEWLMGVPIGLTELDSWETE